MSGVRGRQMAGWQGATQAHGALVTVCLTSHLHYTRAGRRCFVLECTFVVVACSAWMYQSGISGNYLPCQWHLRQSTRIILILHQSAVVTRNWHFVWVCSVCSLCRPWCFLTIKARGECQGDAFCQRTLLSNDCRPTWIYRLWIYTQITAAFQEPHGEYRQRIANLSLT